MLKIVSQHSPVFYATRHSAGFDICAAQDAVIAPGQWVLIPTGLSIVESMGVQTFSVGEYALSVLPELQIRPRSGLALKHGVTVLNAPATIDADYRGEICVTLINHGKETFSVKKGDRIAQGVCALVTQAPGVSIKDVERGTGGFGSTGV
jgi:dUTP pyrophosphatase